MTSMLIVRLPNHLGDACMSLPALELLAARGFALTLVGRAWARALFAAYPWPVLPLPADRLDRVRLLRRSFNPATASLLLTNSFGSALEFRLARLPATGYATDVRRLLLAKPIAVPARWRSGDPPMHMVEYYYALANALVGGDAPPVPRRLSLRLPTSAVERARRMLDEAGVGTDYVVLCPVAVGRHKGRIKAWDGFGALCDELRAAGREVVACPGPNERDAVRDAVPAATLLPETDIAAFAALLAGSRLVVANDSGAAHVAAAVDARLVTVFGVTDARRTGPWSPRAVGVGRVDGWPSFAEVSAAVSAKLQSP